MDDTNKITIFVKEQSNENVNEKMLSNVSDTTSSTIQHINHPTNTNNNVIIKQVYDNDDSTVGVDTIVSNNNHIKCHDDGDDIENNDDDADENNGEEFDFSSSDLDELTTSENNSESGFVDDANHQRHSLVITDQFESGTFDADSTSDFHLTNSFNTSTDEVTSVATAALLNNNNNIDDMKIDCDLLCAKTIEANTSDDQMLLVVVNDIISEAINKCLLVENVETIDTIAIDDTVSVDDENCMVNGEDSHADVDEAAAEDVEVDGNQSDGQNDQVIVNFLGKSNELVGFPIYT